MVNRLTLGIIKRFAEEYNLDIWDWFAASVALFSLIVAALSFIVACKTLRSQKATQRNTAPLVTMPIQKMLYLKLIELLYVNLLRIEGLRILLERNKYSRKPREEFILNFRIIAKDYIHEELFYTQERRFNHVHNTIRWIETYNCVINSIATHLDEMNMTPSKIKRIIYEINRLSGLVLRNYILAFRKNDIVISDQDVLELVLTKDEETVEEITNYLKKTIVRFLHYSHIEYGTILREEEKYNIKDSFVEFLSRHGDKNDDFIKNYYEYSNKYLEKILSSDLFALEETE